MTDWTDWTGSDQPAPGLSPPQRRQWDGGMALVYYVLGAGLSLLLTATLVPALGFYGSVIISEVLAFLIVPLILTRFFDIGFPSWIKFPRLQPSFWVWLLVVVGSFGVVQSNLPVLIDRFWPIPREQIEFYRHYLSAGSATEMLLLLLVAAVVPGICEEVAFRGLIHTGMARSFGVKWAIIAGGLLFALLHLDPWTFIGLWVFGALLGYLRERTGSLIPGILAHIVNNALALAVYAAQGPEDWETPPEFLPWYVVVPAGVVLVLAVWHIHKDTGHPIAPQQDSQASPSRFDSDASAL